MIGRFLIYLQNIPFNPRGKQWIMRVIDRICAPFIVLTKDGLKLSVYASSSMDVSYFRNSESFKSPLLDPCSLIEELYEGETFVDVGANIGYLSLLASRRVGMQGCVYAFEPSHREFCRLIKNISINHACNVVAYCSALGEKSGLVEIQIERDHTGLNHITSPQSKSPHAVIQPVGQLRLDDVLPYEDMDSIKLVKIDVEGAELRVLKGMTGILRLQIIERLCIEITPEFLGRFGDTKIELFNYLKSFGYEPKYDLDIRQYDEVFEVSGKIKETS